MMDTEFVTWIRNRLVNVYGESENVDFVQRLDTIIQRTEATIDILKKWNFGPSGGDFDKRTLIQLCFIWPEVTHD